MAVSEELEVLKEVARRLEKAGVPYMVTGSTAANFYAVPRMTRDIDVVVELAERDADTLVGIFATDFYIDRQAVEEAIKKKGMFNAIHTEYVIKVDFVVRKDSPYRRTEFSRRKKVAVDDRSIYIVAPEDLILSKRIPLPGGHSVSDTSDRIERKFRQLMMERSGAERLRMGCSMHATSQALVKSSIAQKDPIALKQALFLRFYGNDFKPKQRKKILLALRKAAEHDGERRQKTRRAPRKIAQGS